MAKFIPNIFNILNLFRDSQAHQQAQDARDLLHQEAVIGGKLFGPIPAGHRREFFCLDEYTWVWHEEWRDSKGKHNAITTRYDVRPDTILKTQGDRQYQPVSAAEAVNLFDAVHLYAQQIEPLYARSQQFSAL